MRPALRCAELSPTRLGKDEGKTPRVSAEPTYPSTHWAEWEGVKGREAGDHATHLAPPPEGPTSPSSVESHCRTGGGGVAHASQGAPSSPPAPCSAPQPATPVPCEAGCSPFQGAPPASPLTGPGARDAAERGQHPRQEQKERPAPHGGERTGRLGAGVALAGGDRGREDTAGGRSAGGAGGGLSSARAAHWAWLGPWAGRGEHRLSGAPRPPLRRSPLLPWDSRHSPNSGPGHCHAERQSGSAQPCLTKGFPNF